MVSRSLGRLAVRTDRLVRWLLLAMTLLYLVTGYGITEFRDVERFTLGILSRNLAFRIHGSLSIAFIVLLFLHVCLPLVLRWAKTRRVAREKRSEAVARRSLPVSGHHKVQGREKWSQDAR